MKDPLLGYLEYEAKIKPEIAALVARVDDMTDEEIDAAQTPLPWFKIALKRLRDTRRYEKMRGEILDGMQDGFSPDPMGYAAEWNGGEVFVKTSANMLIEVTDRTLLWFPDAGGMWVESTYCSTVDARMASLKSIGRMTKSEYMVKYKEQLQKRHGVYQSPESQSSSPFRVYRH
jgi:hypothetical protein